MLLEANIFALIILNKLKSEEVWANHKHRFFKSRSIAATRTTMKVLSVNQKTKSTFGSIPLRRTFFTTKLDLIKTSLDKMLSSEKV